MKALQSAIGKKFARIRAFRHVYVYFLAYFVNAGFSFITISILTHKLGPGDYGIINLYSSFLILLMPFVSGGILYPISIEYFKKAPDEYRHFFTNAQVITLISVTILTVAFIIFQNPLGHFLRVTPMWIVIMPLAVWWLMGTEIALMMFRMKNKPWNFAAFSIGRNVTEIGLTIALVIGLGWAWEGRLLSAVLIPVFFGMLSIYLFYKWHFIVKKINWSQVKTIAWLSVPYIFERLTIFILNNSDRYFIDKYDLKGTDQVGLYSVGGQIATMAGLVLLSVNGAYQPYIFKNLANKNWKTSQKATWLYIGGTGVLVAMLMLITPLLFRYFIGEKFRGGIVFAYYLCGGYFMWGVYNAFFAYLLFNEKSRLILYLSLAGMGFSVALNFYMVPHYGAYGAAITSILTYSFMALLCIITSWKYFKAERVSV